MTGDTAPRSAAHAPLPAIPAAHRLVLTEALRAPSAHNAQPWRLAVLPGEHYELHYDHLDYLPYDPDDRDAYLAIGAFLETAALAAQRHGLRMSVSYRFDRSGGDLLVGSIRLCPAPGRSRARLVARAARPGAGSGRTGAGWCGGPRLGRPASRPGRPAVRGTAGSSRQAGHRRTGRTGS